MPNETIDYDIPTYLRRQQERAKNPTPDHKIIPPPRLSAAALNDPDTPAIYRRHQRQEQQTVASFNQTKPAESETPPVPETPPIPVWSEPITSLDQLRQLYQQGQITGAQVEDRFGTTLNLHDIQLDDQPHLRHRLKGKYLGQTGQPMNVRLSLFRPDGSFDDRGQFRHLRLALRTPEPAPSTP